MGVQLLSRYMFESHSEGGLLSLCQFGKTTRKSLLSVFSLSSQYVYDLDVKQCWTNVICRLQVSFTLKVHGSTIHKRLLSKDNVIDIAKKDWMMISNPDNFA